MHHDDLLPWEGVELTLQCTLVEWQCGGASIENRPMRRAHLYARQPDFQFCG
jgi:hypothetical protein